MSGRSELEFHFFWKLQMMKALGLVVLLLCVAGPASAAKAKTVRIVKLDVPAVCPAKVASGDNLQARRLCSVLYKGSLTNGSVFDENIKVGRPLEFQVGSGKVIKGWDRGLVGACVGEKRRLTIPPSLGYGDAGQPPKIPPRATLLFDVEVVALNGQSLQQHIASAKAAEAGADTGQESEGGTEGAAADDPGAEAPSVASMDALLATDLGRAGSPFCDACHTVVEEFFEAWMHYMAWASSGDRVEQKDGGRAAPAVTYDDDADAMVQTFCTNATRFGEMPNRMAHSPPAYKPHVAAACARIMAARKREIVGIFLSAEVSGKILPDKKDKVCAEWLHACPAAPSSALSLGGRNGLECAACRALAADTAFQLRRAAYPLGADYHTEKQVYDLMEQSCLLVSYRHRDGGRLQEACESLVDEHGKALAKLVVIDRSPWGDVARRLCTDEAGVCAAQSPSDEF